MHKISLVAIPGATCSTMFYIVGGDQPYQDYEKQSNALKDERISDLHRRICYNQTIYDDKRLEAAEYVGLSLKIQDLVEIGGPTTVTTRVGIEHTAIKIIDNDGNLIVALMLHTEHIAFVVMHVSPTTMDILCIIVEI